MSVPFIGIVGGVGPYAGIDLQRKIADQTLAQVDQEHLAVVSLSEPASIADRTAYLLGEVAENPAHALADQLLRLEAMGAVVAAIPCNTAHAPAIFDVIKSDLAAAGSRLKLLHMIRVTAAYMKKLHPGVRTVGVLATNGTRRVGLYPSVLGAAGLQVLQPDDETQFRLLHPAIYDRDYGIKAHGHATPRARQDLELALAHLRSRGAGAVILGCTELPLALAEYSFGGLPLIDPALALARALIGEIDPALLKPQADPVH